MVELSVAELKVREFLVKMLIFKYPILWRIQEF